MDQEPVREVSDKKGRTEFASVAGKRSGDRRMRSVSTRI